MMARPFVKWAGGKRQLVPVIRHYLPVGYGRYFEPFIGAGALFFDLSPQNAIIGDLNPELINCYQVIKNSVDELIGHLGEFQGKNNKTDFYEIRGWDRQNDYFYRSSAQRAARFIYLNRTCYNGLFRVNSRSEFNAPFGRYKNPTILDEENLRLISQELIGTPIFLADFAKTVESARKKDFIYFDPPYEPISSTASFTSYTGKGFDQQAQERLKATVDTLTKRGCYVMLSNSRCPFIEELYEGYEQVTAMGKRAIAAKSKSRKNVEELLIMNYQNKGAA